MNKKVWRDDKTMMYFINTVASKILSLADGKNLFSSLVTKSLAESKIKNINNETLEGFHLGTEINDRFLQATTFCVSMWERGILKFKISQTNLGNLGISPLLTKAIGSNGELTVENAYRIISNEDSATKYVTYNQFKANLALLLAYDMLVVTFNGSMEDSDEDVVIDKATPHYKIGYIKPGLLTNVPESMIGIRVTGGELIVGALVGHVVVTAAQEAGTTAGTIVGKMQSR